MTRVAAFYRFTAIDDPASYREALRSVATAAGILGSILVAAEGVNGTISGSDAAVESVLDWLRSTGGLAGLSPRDSWTERETFYRLKVRLKQEIVTFGVPGVDPTTTVGTYVEPATWDGLLHDPTVTVIDVRNDYEVSIGSFRGAVDPQLQCFRDFPDWVRANPDLCGKRVAMFCTGGIRCEKASSWLLEQGVDEVFHLQGGILRYLEEVEPAQSSWEGQCFVFDERVSVGHGLQAGTLENCRGCRRPITESARSHASFEAGVRCGNCGEVDALTLERRRERMRQETWARAAGQKHIGRVAD